ncbi:DUF3861 domain-containing protein [Burkholderia sp. WAC0059]|uniref:DUF3861 domain-containing protein n=1 Tax=Burkholderia sp. WAC0059 TaxID=2066022 RepID=UPI000C7F5107|nr:DUF3861 domain-containing protein [Burkholderia sp. WAC0059]PLZ02624.1 DUF3861 domain-containing protein [Burkholderia sp. WAC0059]
MQKKAGCRFRISVERADGDASPSDGVAPLAFEVWSHDDILAIADRVRAGTAFPPDDAAALAIGLKLFSGVMLAHRRDPLFAGVEPAIRAFIGDLKARVAPSVPPASD